MINKCPYCNSNNIITFYEADQPLIVRATTKEVIENTGNKLFKAKYCTDCDLVFHSNPPNEYEINQIYKYYDFIKPALGLGKSKFNNTLKLLKENCHNEMSVLEIGSSDGYVLNEISKIVKEAKGCEPSDSADFSIKEYGLDVKKDYYSNKLYDIEFDLIYMLHVFEHLPDPFSFLDELKSNLKENGLLFIEIPSLKYALQNRQITVFNHEHLFYYSEKFIENLANSKGFEVVYFQENNDVSNILLKLSNNLLSNPDINKSTKEGVSDLVKDFQYKTTENIENLKKVIEKSENCLVWGCGSVSVLIFNQIDKIQENITFTDGDSSKYGKFIPGVGEEVHDPNNIDFSKEYDLIIASSFINEILEGLSRFKQLKIKNVYRMYPDVKQIK